MGNRDGGDSSDAAEVRQRRLEAMRARIGVDRPDFGRRAECEGIGEVGHPVYLGEAPYVQDGQARQARYYGRFRSRRIDLQKRIGLARNSYEHAIRRVPDPSCAPTKGPSSQATCELLCPWR